MNDVRIIATHNGSFHADDVFAVATLKLIFPDAKIMRSRDLDELSKADIRLDVGGVYNPDTGDFDHHQAAFDGKRENGCPYSSFGLIWKHFGDKLCSKTIMESIDDMIVQPIDAVDNGIDLCELTIGVMPYGISHIISILNPFWNEGKPHYDAFLEAVEFAKHILQRLIMRARANEEANDAVRALIAKNEGKKYLVLPTYMPYQKIVREESDILYVVYPGLNNDWRVQGIKKSPDSFELKKPLPDSWGGLYKEQLRKVTGVDDALFCHKKLFVAGAESKKGAIEMAKLAVDA